MATSCEKALDYYRRVATSVAEEVSFSGGQTLQRVRLQVGMNRFSYFRKLLLIYIKLEMDMQIPANCNSDLLNILAILVLIKIFKSVAACFPSAGYVKHSSES